MCNNNNDVESCRCIAEILTVINVLQQNANCCGDTCLETCDRGFLGCGTTTLGCNTRPVILYTCSGGTTPFAVPTTRENVVCGDEGVVCSNVFRVEKVDGNCCTCRVLADNPDTASINPYIATNSFFTIDLNCVCVVKCLTDTFVDSHDRECTLRKYNRGRADIH